MVVKERERVVKDMYNKVVSTNEMKKKVKCITFSLWL